jgi:hypothetical protein
VRSRGEGDRCDSPTSTGMTCFRQIVSVVAVAFFLGRFFIRSEKKRVFSRFLSHLREKGGPAT